MEGVYNFWGRLLIVAICVLVGLIFPFAFIAAAFVGFTLFSDIKDASTGVSSTEPARTVPFYEQESDWTWEKRSEARTESVAEEAFLKAIISHFDLKPAGDDLVGKGVRLAFQRVILRYRVDFILNDWLIVEIDGAQWHSSPEAVERDGIRDVALRELNYAILRISAKTVLRTPLIALRDVEGALALSTTPITEAQLERRKMSAKPRVNIAAQISNGVRSVGRAIDQFDELMKKEDRISAIKSALSEVACSIEMEKTLIDQAIKNAHLQLDLERQFAKDPSYKRLYEQNLKELQTLLTETRSQEPDSIQLSFAAPALTGDDEMDASIRERFSGLMSERNRYLNATADKLTDSKVQALVVQELFKRPAGYHAATLIEMRHGMSIFDRI